MADLFDIAAGHLEQHSGLEFLEARGTLRIALKAGGLEARGLDEPQLRAVLEQLMPRELEVRGVRDPESVCRAVLLDASRDGARVEGARTAGAGADEIFRRMAGD